MKEKENKIDERYLGHPELFEEKEEKDFNLSLHEFPEGYFPKDKVKEFIKKVKKELKLCVTHDKAGFLVDRRQVKRKINKLAGDKLI